LFGIGIGLVIAGLLITFVAPEPSRHQIENLAREQGMVYPQEVLPFNSDMKGGEEN
jgi:hypothetical protein